MSTTAIIADDDPDIRALVRISVKKAGFTLLAELEEGDAALAAIRALNPDLAILDVSMPGLTGVEICTLVRLDTALDGVRLVLLTAAVDDAARARGYAAGANDYISKPFSPRELVARLTSQNQETP